MKHDSEKSFPVTSFFVIVCLLLAGGAVIKGQTSTLPVFDAVIEDTNNVGYRQNNLSDGVFTSSQSGGSSSSNFYQQIPSMIFVGCSELTSWSEE